MSIACTTFDNLWVWQANHLHSTGGKGRCNDYVANIVDWVYLIFIPLHESASDSSEVGELPEIVTNIANPMDKDDIIGDAKQI